MLSKEQINQLEAEVEAYGFKSIETLSEEFINGITLKGYRLSKKEKESIAFNYLNFGLDLNNYEAVEKVVLKDRKFERELKEEEKRIKQFEQLERNYDTICKYVCQKRFKN